MLKNNSQGVALDESTAQRSRMEEKIQVWSEQVSNNIQAHEAGEKWENCLQGDDVPSSSSVPDSLSMERSCTSPAQLEFLQESNSKKEQFSQVLMNPRNEPQSDVSGFQAHSAYPYYMSGVANQLIMPSSAQFYQKNLHELQNHANSSMLSQYNHLPQCPPHVPGMASFPYFPVGMCLQPGQISTNHSWPSFGSSSSTEVKLGKVDRREAALIKFRQKRKERCFDKKIRYVNRKRLAERRPRVRGQFVRKANGVNVDLNGQPVSVDFDDDEEEDEEEHASRDSSPEDDASGYQC